MKNKIAGYVFIIGIFCACCSTPEPQAPVKYHKDTIAKDSHTTQDFNADREFIKKYIVAHPEYHFENNANGFWWASYTKKENGRRITPQDQIKYTYAVKDFKGNLIYSPAEIGAQYAVLNKTKQIRALNDVFPYLHEGEKAILLLPAYVAYGYVGDGNKIAPAQAIIIELEILQLTELP